jgi:hypothetical protein
MNTTAAASQKIGFPAAFIRAFFLDLAMTKWSTKRVLIIIGMGAFSPLLSFALWKGAVYVFAFSRIDALLWIAVVLSDWFIFGWFFYAGLSVFTFYLLKTHFLDRKSPLE